MPIVIQSILVGIDLMIVKSITYPSKLAFTTLFLWLTILFYGSQQVWIKLLNVFFSATNTYITKSMSTDDINLILK